MSLQYITIDRLREGNVPEAPSFSYYEFWGGKDSRNKTGNVHELALPIVRAAQAIREWANAINSNVGVKITSTYRTYLYQKTVIKNGVNKSSHELKIALDGKFISLDGSSDSDIRKEFIARYNTDIRDKGPLYQVLRNLGINGFGIYGPGSVNGAFDFFHIDARNKELGVYGPFTNKNKVHDSHDGTYAIWTRGEPRYLEDDEVSEEEGGDTSGSNVANIDPVQVFEYVIKGDDPYTFNELVSNPDFIGYGAKPENLLNFVHNGVSNHRRLYDTLPKWQQESLYPDGYSASLDLVLTRGAVIYVESQEVGLVKPSNSGTTTNPSNNIISYEYGGNFLDEEVTTLGEFFPYILKRISLDPGYVPTYRSRGLNSKDVTPQITIYAWSRVLFEQGQSGWVSLTPDIISCTLHDDMNGANFQIQLAPVNGRLNVQLDQNDEQPTWEKFGEVSAGTSQTTLTRQNYFRREVGKTDVAVEHLMNDLYYEKILSQNDLIFISFEELQLDDQRGTDSFFPQISGKWFDMIGFVDTANETINANAEATVTVSGTDLTKVLINDRAYFSPYSIGHSSSIYGGNVGDNGRYLEGNFFEFAVFNARTIQEQIEFVAHRLASIGYVPDKIFQNFLNKTEITTTKKVGDDIIEQKKARGVWQLFKLFIDSRIGNLRLADMSLTNPQGSMLELMKSICQEPFVQFTTQTIGDKFYLIARRAPFDQASYKEIVTSVVPNYNFSNTGDGTLSGGASGSQANAYRRYLEELERNRISQEEKDPDTEFERNKQIHVNVLTTTQSSGDAERFLSLSRSEQQSILGTYTIGDVNIEATTFPLIINVGAEDITNHSLQMETQSYAWYQLENSGDFLGKSQGLGYVPAIYFDQFAQVFGNERLKVTSNYTNFQYLNYQDRDSDLEKINQHTARLLSFLVETHIYLPFTRRGSISLSVGDRRIKKGNFIYFRPTREIFYVDAVDHQFRTHNTGVERTTVIQVSRGMVADFILPERVTVDGEEVEVSYFNIVDLPKIQQDLETISLRGSTQERIDYKADFAINDKVFKFFLSNRQFRSL